MSEVWELLERLAPYHIAWDVENKLARVTDRVRRMWDCFATPFDEFAENLRLVRPFAGKLKSEWLGELTDMALHVSYEGKDATLRGQLFRYQQEWVLIATPDVSSSAQLEKMGLKLTDLPFYDVSGDLLISNEANIISLKESQAHAERLQQTLAQLHSVNRILADFVPSDIIQTLDLPAEHEGDVTFHAAAVGRFIERLQQTLEFRQSFLANMSHELRTPLNAILGITEVLSEGIYGEISEKQLEMLGTVHASGQNLLGLINDILDLSKIDAGQAELEKERVLLNNICTSAIALVQTQATQKGLSFEFRFSHEAVFVEVDERRIRDLLLNLLSNAVKFTSEGGVVLSLQVMPKLGQVHVEIRDTGIGIPESDFPQLFQPFVQLDNGYDRQHEGTGLGLAIAQRTAELHQGIIEVESTEGEGSSFKLVLPLEFTEFDDKENKNTASLSTDRTTVPVAEEAKPKKTDLSTYRLLVVDDMKTNLDYIDDYFTHLGVEVTAATNALTAIDEAHRAIPDLILVDIHMPNMSGLDFIRCLRAMPRTKAIPVIVFSASVTDRDKEICLEVGADLFIDKPCELSVLTDQIVKQLKSKE